MRKVIFLLFLVTAFVFAQSPGQKYSVINRVIAAVNVWHSVELDFDELSSGLSEVEVLALYPDLGLNCMNDPSDMGDRSCFTNVRRVNGFDAWFIEFFFDGDKLNQVKVDFIPAGHKEILNVMEAEHGEPHDMKPDQNGNTVIGWILKSGVLATNQTTYSDNTTQVLWLSKQKVLKSFLMIKRL